MPRGVRARVKELVSPLTNPAYRRVWLARLISEFGDWAARLALALLVLERTGSAGLSGAIIGMTFLPWLGLGQYLATFGDRFDRRTVMVVADVARALTYVVIALIDGPVWVYFVLAFLASAFDAPFKASRSAVLVNVTRDDEYPNALRLEAVTAQTGTLAGLLAGGGFSAVLGPQGALAANAITFIASAAVLAGLPPMAALAAKRPSMAAGIRVLRTDGYVRRALTIAVLVTIPATTIETQLPVYTKQIAGLSAWGVGAVAIAIPLGTIVTTLLVRAEASDALLLKRGSLIALAAGVVIGPAFAIWTTGVAMVAAFFFVGVAFGCTVPTNVVAGRRIPDAVRSSVFGFLQGVILVGFGIGSVAGGALAEQIGVREAVVWCGAAIAVIAAATYLAPVRVPADSPAAAD